jgi:hypothetical protein
MLYSYFIYAGILKSKVTAGWAGLYLLGPELSCTGRNIMAQAGISLSEPD